jgi:hypothetical protein
MGAGRVPHKQAKQTNLMNKTTAILAALAMGAASALAGTTPVPTPSGKGKVPVCPAPVDPCAGPISYNTVELIYIHTNPDGSGDDFDGANLRLTYSPLQNFYIVADATFSESSLAEDLSLAFGVGGYLPLTENMHAAVDGGVVWYQRDFDLYANDDDFGWYVRPHLRVKWSGLELYIGAQYVDVGGSDGYRVIRSGVAHVGAWEIEEWSAFANLYYQVAPGWDLTAGIDYSEDRASISGGLRYRF